MKWSDYDSSFCSVARSVEVLGDRWTVLVLRDVFNGVRRFDDISRHLGIARDVLTKRLATLVEEGILRRVPYQEPGSRTRYEYRLTQAGLDLRPVLIALIEWGDRYRPDPSGPPLSLTHDGCGEPVRVRVECAAGHEIGSRTRLHLDPGPGARRLAEVK
ncbi:MAG TPA: helix-turn-helix domain-containing protein [Rugosimonospora sp.]|nr:helix-turn-helix domain-containing protein [Rugosimonospora sp.]